MSQAAARMSALSRPRSYTRSWEADRGHVRTDALVEIQPAIIGPTQSVDWWIGSFDALEIGLPGILPAKLIMENGAGRVEMGIPAPPARTLQVVLHTPLQMIAPPAFAFSDH
jgi:hypothetical protein